MKTDKNNEWRKQYEAHIRSSQWKGTRAAILKMRGEKCEDCGYGSATLQVHHLTYERLGKESMKDLVILCHKCHVKADAKRDEETEAKKKERDFAFQQDNINKAFRTWCIKRGSDPEMGYDRDWEAFNDWIYSCRE